MLSARGCGCVVSAWSALSLMDIRRLTMDSARGEVDESEVRKQKAALRKEVDRRVNALTEEEILRQSAAITAKVLAHPKYKNARSVSVYLSFEKEVRTDDLVADILRSGRTCYIPRFRKGVAEMEMVRLESEADLQALPVNRWGIRQPADHEPRQSVFDAGELDLVLMPGQAFALSVGGGARRLGRGKGYYDRFLTRCRAELRAPPATLALAFREQLVPSVPTTPRDVDIDALLYADD